MLQLQTSHHFFNGNGLPPIQHQAVEIFDPVGIIRSECLEGQNYAVHTWGLLLLT